MISKKLEILLGDLAGRSSSEMVQRFHSLRQADLLPKSRGRHAADLWTAHVAYGILSLCSPMPSMAGDVVKSLGSLRSIGETQGNVLDFMRDIIDYHSVAHSVQELRMSEGDHISGEGFRVTVVYLEEGIEKINYFISSDEYDLFRKTGKPYDRRYIVGAAVETVLYPPFFDGLAEALKKDNHKEKYEAAKKVDHDAFERSVQSFRN